MSNNSSKKSVAEQMLALVASLSGKTPTRARIEKVTDELEARFDVQVDDLREFISDYDDITRDDYDESDDFRDAKSDKLSEFPDFFATFVNETINAIDSEQSDAIIAELDASDATDALTSDVQSDAQQSDVQTSEQSDAPAPVIEATPAPVKRQTKKQLAAIAAAALAAEKNEQKSDAPASDEQTSDVPAPAPAYDPLAGVGEVVDVHTGEVVNPDDVDTAIAAATNATSEAAAETTTRRARGPRSSEPQFESFEVISGVERSLLASSSGRPCRDSMRDNAKSLRLAGYTVTGNGFEGFTIVKGGATVGRMFIRDAKDATKEISFANYSKKSGDATPRAERATRTASTSRASVSKANKPSKVFAQSDLKTFFADPSQENLEMLSLSLAAYKSAFLASLASEIKTSDSNAAILAADSSAFAAAILAETDASADLVSLAEQYQATKDFDLCARVATITTNEQFGMLCTLADAQKSALASADVQSDVPAPVASDEQSAPLVEATPAAVVEAPVAEPVKKLTKKEEKALASAASYETLREQTNVAAAAAA